MKRDAAIGLDKLVLRPRHVNDHFDRTHVSTAVLKVLHVPVAPLIVSFVQIWQWNANLRTVLGDFSVCINKALNDGTNLFSAFLFTSHSGLHKRMTNWR